MEERLKLYIIQKDTYRHIKAPLKYMRDGAYGRGADVMDYSEAAISQEGALFRKGTKTRQPNLF